MLYVITGKDSAGSLEARKQVRAEHLARARAISRMPGALIIAGPCPAIDSPDPVRPAFPAA